MDISVKTLNRYIKAGAVSRIEMNRNIIRVLKSNLAK
jgi:predicted site-specific integrase-resolvase